MTAQARYLILALCLMLGACSIFPQQPRDTSDAIATGFVVVESLAESIGQAQLAGQITVVEEDAFLDQLQIAQDSLVMSKVAFAKQLPEDAHEALLAAQRILTELQLKVERSQ